MIDLFGENWLGAGRTTGLKFIAPVAAGDTLRTWAKVRRREEEGSEVEFTFEVWCENQNGDRVLVGEATGQGLNFAKVEGKRSALMVIGIPREIKAEETRVAITPIGVAALVAHGHQVLIETRAGAGSSILDAQYTAAGGPDAGLRPGGLDPGRSHPQGQGAPCGRVPRCCVPASSCLPISISPRRNRSPGRCWTGR